jgi:outer membrane murein-binding lipoprotein Lpp
MAEPDYAQDIMNTIKDLIPKTPEESRAASRSNPVGQWFEDFSSGNMFERIHGYDGTETLYAGLVDPKGGKDTVTTQSYLGVVAKFVRAIFTYGDDSAKDADAIYNTREGKPDIVTGGTNSPNTTSLEGSVLYTRVERIFKYYSAKTQWMIVQTDGLRAMITRLENELVNFQNEAQQSNTNQQQTNSSTTNSLQTIQQDITDLKAKATKLENDIKTTDADLGTFRNTTNTAISRIDATISDIKKFVKMP